MMKNGDSNDSELGKEIMDLDKGKQITVLNSESKEREDEKAMLEQKFKYKYPEAIATYKEVVENINLFKNTLESVHSKMGTKYMIPIIGGKELDLHRLFVEVTSRGGVDKVINDKKWREVTAVFNFPPTATNASFVLRKYYISLLSHYEQIYFFRSQGWNSPPQSASPNTPSNNVFPSDRSAETMPRVLSGSRVRKRRTDSELIPPGLSVPMNKSVVGTIEGKFDQGYFVSITMDTQKLRGVVFHVQEQPQTANQAAESSGPARRRRRKKIKRDPTHPKPNRSGYNFFFAEQHARLKPLNQGKDRDISRQIGELWSKLTDTERAVYQEKGAKDKERYVSEMAEYRGSLRQAGGPAINNVMPLQQRPAEMVSDKSDDSDSKMDIEDDEEEVEAGDDDSDSNNTIESEVKESEEDESEHETSHKMPAATESTSPVNDTSIEGDGGFEFKKRNGDDLQVEAEPQHFNASEDVQSKNESEPSNNCQEEFGLSNNDQQ